ncbi:hypothetical protein ACFO5O_13075 [Geojedonia litorea]|uniref:DUF3324 domain-containing protein n=1 Tax=Geojedonia litorea TaxID=1268269 RepID=A0ABV9N4J5_9FLAO
MKSLAISIISFITCINFLHANVVVLNGLTHSYSGSAGQTFEGYILLANTSNEQQRVTFSLSEAIYSCEQERVIGNDIDHKNSSSSWFESSVTDVTLSPKQKYSFKYSITVPNDETLNGSYWTTLIVDLEKPIREEKVNNIALGTKIRYAIRLLTDVNNKNEVAIDFKSINLKLNPVNQKKQLDVKILNESPFIENVKLSLEVYDAYGNKVLGTKTKRAIVFPEVCRDFSIDVSGLPVGEYQCIVLADSDEEYIGTNISLTIK